MYVFGCAAGIDGSRIFGEGATVKHFGWTGLGTFQRTSLDAAISNVRALGGVT